MKRKMLTRRTFNQSATALGAGSCLLSGLPLVPASETNLRRNDLNIANGVEPTVSLIRNTPRGKLVELLAARIKSGLSYRELLAALLLVGVQNVQPRPSVGFKFHCVLVINSCHLASVAGPDTDRWLPLLWAADYFKSSQASEARESGWQMKPVNEALVPSPTNARRDFIDSMESWDAEKADAATVGICRHLGSTEVFNLFARFAARDYRSIGHKAIFLANAWRTLQVIGWEFCEPVLRSLSFALLNHRNEPNPSKSDLAADRSWKENLAKIEKVPNEYLAGKLDETMPLRLIDGFRVGSPNDASTLATEMLSKGASAQTIWDGVFLGAGELLMKQPGIIGLHGLTTANAIHYLWKTSADRDLRKRLLLQVCSFNPLFRESAESRGKLNQHSLEKLMENGPSFESSNTMEDILADISSDPFRAAQRLRQYSTKGGKMVTFVDESRKLLFQKGSDAHDYKFSAAIHEDYLHISPAWRDEFLAMSLFNLKGTGHADNRLNQRIRNAF